MNNHFTVDVLTPSKVVARNVPAEALLVPTIKGQTNVLENHTHIVTKLEPGIVSVFGGADDSDRHFFVSIGTCKILNDKIIILANTAEEQVEVDAERAEAALKNAQDRLAKSDNMSDEEIEKYRRKEERAKLRIRLSGFKK